MFDFSSDFQRDSKKVDSHTIELRLTKKDGLFIPLRIWFCGGFEIQIFQLAKKFKRATNPEFTTVSAIILYIVVSMLLF